MRSALLRLVRRAREGQEGHARPLRRFAHREHHGVEAPALRGPLVQQLLQLLIGDVAGLDHLVENRHGPSRSGTPYRSADPAATCSASARTSARGLASGEITSGGSPARASACAVTGPIAATALRRAAASAGE